MLYGVMIFAKALIRSASVGKRLLGVRGTVTDKRLGRAVSHLTRSHSPSLRRYLPDSTKVAVDADLRRYEMLPLVPGRIPAERKKRGIDIHLCFPAAIAIQRIPIEVFNAAQRSAKLALPLVRQIRQQAAHEEGVPILRQFARDNALAEAAVGEQGRSVGILKEGVVTGAEVGMRQEVEGPLGALHLWLGGGVGFKFKPANSVRKAQDPAGVAVGGVRSIS